MHALVPNATNEPAASVASRVVLDRDCWVLR